MFTPHQTLTACAIFSHTLCSAIKKNGVNNIWQLNLFGFYFALGSFLSPFFFAEIISTTKRVLVYQMRQLYVLYDVVCFK